jgi:hypothetical protein
LIYKSLEAPEHEGAGIQFKGDPVRVLFAFDPKRRAVLLLGGAKAGEKDWYRRNVPLADQELTVHLKEMEKEKTR